MHDTDVQELRHRLAHFGQGHVLRWWDELDAEQRESLYTQLESIDLEQLQRLARDTTAGLTWKPEQIRPSAVLALPESFEDWEREQRAAETGEEALKAGQVAVLMVAGGQGTRLGYDGPKGAFPIGPVSGKSLFQFHAEKVLALGRRYEQAIPFLVMTSPENDAATRRYFAEHAHFGLDATQVTFFQQGAMPAVDAASGRLLLADRHQLALSPNGHGGVLLALALGGHLGELTRRGIRYLFYFQVDNPLVKIADPAFLGYHIEAGAEVSSKVVRKTDPKEKVGLIVAIDGRMQVIEYSDFKDELAPLLERRTPDGQLELWAGSIAIHVFSVAFLERLAAGGEMLPFHRAHKIVPHVDDAGNLVKPDKANAIKFEMFVFDSIPLARQAIAVETSRAEEFEPVKNATGENSPETARQAMSNLFAGWLNRAGVPVARRADGAAAVPIEISPLAALDGEELRDQVQGAEAVTGPFLLQEPLHVANEES